MKQTESTKVKNEGKKTSKQRMMDVYKFLEVGKVKTHLELEQVPERIRRDPKSSRKNKH